MPTPKQRRKVIDMNEKLTKGQIGALIFAGVWCIILLISLIKLIIHHPK